MKVRCTQNMQVFLCGARPARARALMQRSEKSAIGRIHCHEHFSLAKPLHLAIMSGQLGNEWYVRFHRRFR
jgi:hypothetical protein